MKKLLFLLLLILLPACALAETSTSLTERRTDSASGYRIDYIDAAGQPAIATDKGYASVQCSVSGGLKTAEFFFDESGEPIEVSGACGRSYLYADGRCVQISYLDRDGRLVCNSSGYAVVKRSVDDAGRVVQEMYFDESGQPAARWAGQYGLRREAFDENNRVTRFTYLDAQGRAFQIDSGYATVQRSYDAAGNPAVDMYFGTDGLPARAQAGQYGIKYLRDEAGGRSGTVYLDAGGQPAPNSSGYTIVYFEYDEWGNVITHRYCDADGNPVALSRGQYGQRFEFNRKEKLGSYYIDANGNELFLLDQFLGRNPLLNLLVAVLLLLAAALLPRRPRLLLLAGYLLFILYMTLLLREQGDQRLRLELFWSIRMFFKSHVARVEILNNILLFIPLGALAYSFYPHPLSLLFPAALSTLIEAAQLILGLGVCDLDDLLCNALGGGIGWLSLRLTTGRSPHRRPKIED